MTCPNHQNGTCRVAKLTVSPGVCEACLRDGKEGKHLLKRKLPMRGIGDVLAAMTTAVGIKPCGGCKQRQEKLNKLVPFS